MLKKLSSIPFCGTKEQEAALMAVINEYKDTPGALMPILQKAQDIYGYLPTEKAEKGSHYSAYISSGTTGHEGGDMFIAFNNRFLIDSVRACRGEKTVISLSSALTSINIEPETNEEGGEDIFMLLPVRMKD